MKKTLLVALLVSLPFFSAVSASWAEILPDDGLACIQQADQIKLSEMAVQRDQEAFAKAARSLLYSGRCTVLEKGSEIFVIDKKFDLIKVRRKGEVEEYWASHYIIEQ